METYPKINALYKRHTEGKKKGRFIEGQFAQPEFEYLFFNRWEFTEKVDGTNIRVGLNMYQEHLTVLFSGRTDNAQIPKDLKQYLDNTFLETPGGTAHRFMLGSNNTDVILFGEGYGPKIQSGGKYREDASFVLFDVKIGDFWLSRENVNDIARKLGIDSVPVVGYGTLQDAIDIVSSGYVFNKDGGIMRYGRNGLDSKWGSFEAEGIIARPVVPLFDRKGNRVTTKIKAVDFK